MRIRRMRANHMKEPVGYALTPLTLSYVAESDTSKKQTAARIEIAEDADFSQIVFDSGKREDICSTAVRVPFTPGPGTRYYWRVTVWGDNGDSGISRVASFETAKPGVWTAKWITPCTDKSVQVCLEKTFTVKKRVRSARLYIIGLGLYEAYLNGEKQGDEALMPGFCCYDAYLPYQTIVMMPETGENTLSVMLGDGWYKGIFGLRKKFENYGDELACLAEIHILYQDGTREVIGTDETWRARRSPVTESGIYPGEVYDPGIDRRESFAVRVSDASFATVEPRIDPPLRIVRRVKPAGLIVTPKGETVLDMGQNMVGWLGFHCNAPKGTRIRMQFGELLQDGCFYNANLRTAKAEFTYISDGEPRDVRQHFTFFGFRYVNITGWIGQINPADFEGLVISSDIDRIGSIETNDPDVNRLFQNAQWSQTGNFLDIPTDCPQRDERCGWTGDAQIFSGTACFNADAYPFYAKFGRDLYEEQKKRAGGVPDTVPTANYTGNTSAAWGDAAAVIPWNVYLHSGDKQILAQQFESMRGWVDYIRREDIRYGDRHLWQSGFHYGDWLAMDGAVPGGVYGATDPFLIASAYYYYSASITAKAADILNKTEEAHYYSSLASDIREAFIREYYTPEGRLAVDTTTAYVVTLFTGLVPQNAVERSRRALFNRLRRTQFRMDTGFVGTPWLCRVLSENGMHAAACRLLMNTGLPGWLYEVRMGATTIWERWNSVMPDGKVSGTAMNSMNHYSYGSIVEWMYRDLAGIRPNENAVGFKRFTLAPMPDDRLTHVKASLDSASGIIRSEWRTEEGRLYLYFTVPFDTRARIILPCADAAKAVLPEDAEIIERNGKDITIEVSAGDWNFEYSAPQFCRRIYGIDSPVEELLAYPPACAVVEREYFDRITDRPFEKEVCTLRELMNGPFTNIPYAEQERIDALLREV